MDIISRAGWGARPPTSVTTVAWPQRNKFIVHYSAGPTTQTVRAIQDFHMDTRGWSDIGYNFLVDTSGRLYTGRGWTALGTHTVGHNTSGIAVCFIGRDGDATEATRRAIRWLWQEAERRKGGSLARFGHRDLDQTTCPGDRLHAWVHAGMQVTTEEDDMSEDAERRINFIDGRVHAMTYGNDEVAEGFLGAGIPVWTVREIKTLRTAVASLAARVEALGSAEAQRDAADAQRDADLRTLVEQYGSGQLDAEAVVRRMGELLAPPQV